MEIQTIKDLKKILNSKNISDNVIMAVADVDDDAPMIFRTFLKKEVFIYDDKNLICFGNLNRDKKTRYKTTNVVKFKDFKKALDKFPHDDYNVAIGVDNGYTEIYEVFVFTKQELIKLQSKKINWFMKKVYSEFLQRMTNGKFDTVCVLTAGIL